MNVEAQPDVGHVSLVNRIETARRHGNAVGSPRRVHVGVCERVTAGRLIVVRNQGTICSGRQIGLGRASRLTFTQPMAPNVGLRPIIEILAPLAVCMNILPCTLCNP